MDIIKTLINKVIHRIVLAFIGYCEKHNKIEHIKGHGITETYLLRYQLIKSRYFNCYIHRVLRSDHDVPHDHPWAWMSYIVDGQYYEHRFIKDFQNNLICSISLRKKGSITFRKAHSIHKLVVPQAFSVEEKDKAPLTLFVTGPHQRVWGFWPGNQAEDQSGNYYKAKFCEWKKYLNL